MAIDLIDAQMELAAAGREDLAQLVYDYHAAANSEIERLRALACDAYSALEAEQYTRAGQIICKII